jgi:Protein of unknown function (DUF3822)
LQATDVTYKLLKKIKDERFDEDTIHQYALFVNIGTRDFQLCVIDTKDNRCLVLEDYVFPSVSSHQELVTALDQLFEAHAFAKAGFWKQIKVSFKNQSFVQVPNALYSEDALADYLKFNTHINSDVEDFLPVSLKSTQAVTVFAIHKDIKAWLKNIYPNNNPIFVHQSAVLIEGIMQAAINRKDNPLYIYVDRFKLHVLSASNGKLIYYNQFSIKQFSDYIKYIMLVMKSLNMDQAKSEVVLWGYIGKNSPHYIEFYKYIKNVSFGARPPYIQFGYFFDEVQDHHFFDLYSIHLCG